MELGNCIIAQSGGPTAAINATLAGVYTAASQKKGMGHIYGGLNGIEGILQEKFVDLRQVLCSEERVRLLETTPSSFLGSCRYKLGQSGHLEEEMARLFSVFADHNIRYFFYIGGNDSMDTILQLEKYQQAHGGNVAFIGVPKTIDNDLMCIDHTPGFGSAAKYIATTVQEIALDTAVYDMDSIVVVEVMGRNAGWLALSAGLARGPFGKPAADLIYLPEFPFSEEQLVADIQKVRSEKRQVVVVISEGIQNAHGERIAEAKTKDSFGHGQLGGAAKQVEAIIKARIGGKVRAVELNVPQRAAGHCLSATDIVVSVQIGEAAVDAAWNGESGVMVTTERAKEGSYRLMIGTTDIIHIANQEKIVPESYVNQEKNHLSPAGLAYLAPLIQGEISAPVEAGLPRYAYLSEWQ